MVGRRFLVLSVVLIALVGCKGQSAAGTYFVDATSAGAKAALPGADKILLTLKDDGSLDLAAGPLKLLTGTWKEDAGKVTFSKGQGLIGTDYRIEGTHLVPVDSSAAGAGWRFTRK